MYIAHRAFIPPGRLSGAAACATKYTAHRPPHHKTSTVSVLPLHQLPHEADWLPPRPLLAECHRISIIDARRTADLPPSPLFQPLLVMVHTAVKSSDLLFQINKHTHNNNEEVPPVYHNQKGLIGFRYIRKSKLKVLYNIVGGRGYTYYQCVQLNLAFSKPQHITINQLYFA